MCGDIEGRTIPGSVDMCIYVVDLIHHRIKTCFGQKFFKTLCALFFVRAEGRNLNEFDLLVDRVRFIVFQIFEGVNHLVGF